MRPITPPLLCALLLAGMLAACGPAQQETPLPTQAGLPNPASVFCEGQGGRLEIRSDAAGNQTGYCIFSDGSECDEWAYFRGECQPSQAATQAAAPTSLPVIEPAATPPDGWAVYTHPTLGYSFFYLEGSTFVSTDTARYTTVVGPLVLDNGEHWPWFSINHPDEPDYHPPADADLQVWLAERSRLPGQVVGTRAIAGETAIHTRFEDPRGPQAHNYNDDRFYFVHGGQLYEIVIMHTGKEDWDVYDVFLDSFAFQE
jgi:putative hemolysin